MGHTVVKLTFYTGRDNAEDLVLLDDGTPIDTTALTRVVLGFGGTDIDSQTVPEAFQWPVSLIYEGASVKGLRLLLGGQGLADGMSPDVRLTVYDVDHPNGLVWTERLVVLVKT